MSELSRENIEYYIARAREFKLGSEHWPDIIKFYSELPIALRLAMYFCPGGPVDDVPADSRFELEELQLHTFLRMPWQARGELVRRAERFLGRTFKVDVSELIDPEVERRRMAAQQLIHRAQRIARGDPSIWSVGDLLPLIADMATYISHGAGVQGDADQPPKEEQAAPSEELDALPAGMCQPIENTETSDVLRLFRAFVIRNATVWEMGSNHHHPIWQLVAMHIDGPEPVAGPEYAFISPRNRQQLCVLKRLEEERALEERGE